MSKLRLKKLKFNDVTKIKFILVLLVVVLTITLSVPSLARYKNYMNLEAMFNENQTWDGSIATSFASGSGTEEDPYIISTASEFAFFATNVDISGYSGQYFKLSNNIILNDGLFGYDETNRTYTINDTTFYLGEYSENVYDNSELTGNIISTVNKFNSLNDFKGYFDGDYHTIYGLYLTEETENLSLFKSLSGKVENLYFKNSFVYGGSSTAILSNNVTYGEVNNVSVDGIVVGKGTNRTSSFTQTLEDVSLQKTLASTSHTVNLNVPVGYTFDKVSITGNAYIEDPKLKVMLNGTEVTGDFDLQLDPNVTALSIKDNGFEFKISQIKFTNMVIKYEYNYPITSGLVSSSSDSNFNNVVNKAKVYGTNVSGLIGEGTNLSISNAYNLGNLKGTNVSGVVNSIVNNSSTVINKVYNNGELIGTTTNFIGNISNSNTVLISNAFNTKVLNNTFGNVSGNTEVLNVYDVNSSNTISGNLNGTKNVVTKENINKTLLTETLGYEEYVDDEYLVENPNNIWIYEYEEVPVLYVDELNNPIASLNMDIYSWKDVGYQLSTLFFAEERAFNVTPLNGFNKFKNVYYYIHQDEIPLNRNGIESITEWIEYEDIVSLDEEGKQIIYIKIVDQTDHNYYINSDVLFFDLKGPNINLSLNENVWNSSKESLDSKYINETIELGLDISDTYSEVDKTYYYISDIYIPEENITEEQWNEYVGNISIDKKGANIVYVKSIDTNGHVNIINSDYIIYGGYSELLNIGTNSNNPVDIANITDKSSVTYKFTYDDNISYTTGYNSNLVLSNNLPNKTIITFIDHKLNYVYTYEVKAEESIIPLKNFKMIGNKDDIMFDEIAYLVTNTKEVSVIFDFTNSIIDEDFEFDVTLDLRDELGNVVLSTLKDTLKTTKIYKNLASELSITNKSVIYGINYDSNSKNLIELEYSLDTLIKDNTIINDTRYENMKTGIAIKLMDSEGNIVDKKYLKNMEFIVDGVNYTADSDGIVRINMGVNLDKVTKGLTIVTHENDLDLKDGNYSLVINPFVANDGKYTNIYSNSNISIPVVSDYEEILDFEFNVKMSDDMKILVKENESVSIPFTIISNNEFTAPSVRISLYKKRSFSAYDQNYDLIDLDTYSSNELELATDYSYIVNGNKLDLQLDLTTMEKKGYELRFELFDGDKRIDLIKEKFIIK